MIESIENCIDIYGVFEQFISASDFIMVVGANLKMQIFHFSSYRKSVLISGENGKIAL